MTNEEVLKILKGGLEVYNRHVRYECFSGMCSVIPLYMFYCLEIPCESDFNVKHIARFKAFEAACPEFNPEFLNADCFDEGQYWWPRENTEVRINAFNVLIEIYTKKAEEEQKK